MSTRRRDQLQKLQLALESAPPVVRVRIAPFARYGEAPPPPKLDGPACMACSGYGFSGAPCAACGRVRSSVEGQELGAEEIVVPGGDTQALERENTPS
jgi:hypothetical protein